MTNNRVLNFAFVRVRGGVWVLGNADLALSFNMAPVMTSYNIAVV